MRFNKNGNDDGGFEINLTPMIDVVFLLLIFFMVSTTFIVTDSIKIDLPKAKGDKTEKTSNVNIVVEKSGRILIDGKTVSDQQILNVLTAMQKEGAERTIVLEADSGVNHGRVVFVMDAGRKAGFKKFAVAVEEE